MKPALGYHEPKIPMYWDEITNGEQILSSIEAALDPWWPRIFGYHLLKLGSLSNGIDSSRSLIPHQVSVGLNKKYSDVVAEIDDLPFLEHSVDCCLLSHTLEYSVDPHHILREADRVLIPNGYMLLTGFNPISLAGLNQLIPFRRKSLPWNGRFFTPMRVKDWLNLLGYEILSDQRVLHCGLNSKINSNSWWSKSWQKFASNYLSSFGSIYIIVAKKRVHPLTPIRPKWKVRPNFQPVKVSTMTNPQIKRK